MDTEPDYLWGRRHSILYRIELSVLYHRKRERFFDFVDKADKSISVIGGSAAFASLGGPEAIKVFAALVAVSATLSLVFGFGEKARRHADHAARFRELESDVISKGERDFTEADLNTWEAKTRSLEITEPAALSTLVVLCQNELAISQGQPQQVVNLPLYKRVLAQVWDFQVASEPKPGQ